MNLTKAHRNGIWSLAFSPDGRIIATGSSDNTIRLWSVPERDGISESRKTIRALFDLIAKITGRDDIEFLRVTENFQVLVRTGDAPDGIPLEILSQGLISLLSWVGVLCQRLKEVSPDGSSALPHDGPALVLIDELDAHMHPRWQQVLVDRLRDLFPKTQFIGCTHSPLIIAGLDKAEVERFRLSNGRVEMTNFDADMTLGRTDQILAGELFDLSTAFDPQTQRYKDRYKELLAKSEPTDAEQREQQKLAKLLESRIPPPAANLIARRAQGLLEALDNNAQNFLALPRDKAIEFNTPEQEIYDRMGALRKALEGGAKA